MFEITVCVLKRDTLAPFLFVIVLNYLTRKVMREKRKCMGLPWDLREGQGKDINKFSWE